MQKTSKVGGVLYRLHLLFLQNGMIFKTLNVDKEGKKTKGLVKSKIVLLFNASRIWSQLLQREFEMAGSVCVLLTFI